MGHQWSLLSRGMSHEITRVVSSCVRVQCRWPISCVRVLWYPTKGRVVKVWISGFVKAFVGGSLLKFRPALVPRFRVRG